MKLGGSIEKNEYDDNWKNSLNDLVSILKSLKNEKNIIVNEVYLAEKFYKDNKLFEFSNIEDIRIINNKLKKMYTYFKELFNNVNVIKLNNIYADYNHKYLCRPHLLSYKYYEELNEYLYNNFSNTQENYVIPFQLASYDINDSSIINYNNNNVNIEKIFESKNDLLCYFENKCNGKNIKLLPSLKKNAIYEFHFNINHEKSLKINIILQFLDENEKVIQETIFSNYRISVKVPSNYKSYKIYIYSYGVGNIEAKYLRILRKRTIGNILHYDNSLNIDNNIINYYFEKGNLNYLIIDISTYSINNINNNIYASTDILETLDVNKLYIVEEYERLLGKDNLNKSVDEYIEKLILEKVTACNVPLENVILLGNLDGFMKILYYGLKLNIGHIYIGAIFNLEYMKKRDINEYYLSIIKDYISNSNINTLINFYNVNKYCNNTLKSICNILDEINIKYNLKNFNISNMSEFISISKDYLDKELKNIIRDSKVNITVLGSCDSRDIFRLSEEYNMNNIYNIKDYYARSSIISLVSNSIKLSDEQVNLTSNFKKRCVLRDFNKDFIINIESIARESDFIIIDFMEERFDLLRIEDKYITRNWEVREAGLESE